MVKSYYPHKELQGLIYPTFIKMYLSSGELTISDLANVEKVKSVLSNNDFAKLLLVNQKRSSTFTEVASVFPCFGKFLELFGDLPDSWVSAEASSNIYPDFKSPSIKAIFPNLVDDSYCETFLNLLPKCYPTFTFETLPNNTFILFLEDFDIDCMGKLTVEQKFYNQRLFSPKHLYLHYQVKPYFDMLSKLFRAEALTKMQIFKLHTVLLSKIFVH